MKEQTLSIGTEVFENAKRILNYAESYYSSRFYNEAVDSSYQSVLDVVKSVLTLETFDFSDPQLKVFSYFYNRYILSGLFPDNLGPMLGKLKYMHEMCNPEYGYLATPRDAREQIITAENFITSGTEYLKTLHRKKKYIRTILL